MFHTTYDGVDYNEHRANLHLSPRGAHLKAFSARYFIRPFVLTFPYISVFRTNIRLRPYYHWVPGSSQGTELVLYGTVSVSVSVFFYTEHYLSHLPRLEPWQMQTSQLSRFRTISHDVMMTQRFLTTTFLRFWLVLCHGHLGVKGRMKLMSWVNFDHWLTARAILKWLMVRAPAMYSA